MSHEHLETAPSEEQAVTVDVPATTSNLGPGFDTLGLALDLCNRVSLRIGSIGDSCGIDLICGEGNGTLATDQSNLVIRSAITLYHELGQEPPPLRATLHNRIPLARGLGSSGAAVVGGLLAANALNGQPFGEAEILGMAAGLEGHPDNVAPALMGGLVVSAIEESRDGQRIVTHRLPPPEIVLVLCIPDHPLPTGEARQVVPKRISLDTAVHNLGRVSLLVAAFATGDHQHLRVAMDDRLHQPARATVFPPLEPVIAAALSAGASGACLSGAGSTLLAIVSEGTHAARNVAAAMVEACAAAGYPARSKVTKPRAQGARVFCNSIA